VPRYASKQDRIHRSPGSVKHGHIHKSKSGKIVALVFIVLLISSASFFLSSSHKSHILEDRNYIYGPTEIPVKLTATFDISSAAIIFQFNSIDSHGINKDFPLKSSSNYERFAL
jgi:hypothetical protein